MSFKDLVAGAMNWHKTINDNNAEAETRIGSLERNLYNPNLLINSNFKVSELVNQRGQTSYSNSGYVFDMWQVMKNMDTSIELKENCITIKENSGTSGYSILEQRIENFKELAGKTVTLSFKAKSSNNSDIASAIRVDGVPLNSENHKCYTEWQIFAHTFVMPNEINNELSFRIYTNIAYAEIDIEYIKLEFGEIATLFVDDDPSTKLSKCQRYLQKIAKQQVIGHGIVRTLNTTSTVVLTLGLSTPMRIDTPNVSFNNANIIVGDYTIGIKNVTNIVPIVSRATNSIVSFYISTDNVSGLVLNSFVRVQMLSTDDYILLSAEN